MPKATVTKTTEKFDLKTLEGGFVEIRRMTYGERLTRQNDLMQSSMTGDKISLDLDFKSTALTDFGSLIISHNLTDENDVPLNFKNAADVIRLDPIVGEEIGNLIDSMNSFDKNQEQLGK